MSSQGNVKIYVKPGEMYMFTTGRWSGPALLKLCQNCLDLYDPANTLHDLCHDPSIDRPIQSIGNADVPTIMIDYVNDAVTIYTDWDDEVLGFWDLKTFKLKEFSDFSQMIRERYE